MIRRSTPKEEKMTINGDESLIQQAIKAAIKLDNRSRPRSVSTLTLTPDKVKGKVNLPSKSNILTNVLIDRL